MVSTAVANHHQLWFKNQELYGVCDGNLDIQEAGNAKVIYVYLIGAFCRKDQHRESQGSQSEDGEQSNARILYRRTKGQFIVGFYASTQDTQDTQEPLAQLRTPSCGLACVSQFF